MRIEFDNCRARISGLSPGSERGVRASFTTFAPNYLHSPLFRAHKWDGRVSAIARDLTLDSGFLPSLIEAVRDVDLIDRREVRALSLRPTTIQLRDYQIDAIEAALGHTLHGMWWPRGVIEMATGGGKTLTAAAMIEMTQVQTLFLVHRTELVEQTRREFRGAGIASGTVRAGEIVGPTSVVVCTIQSLMSWAFEMSSVSPKEGESQEAFLERVLERESREEERRERGEPIRNYLQSVEQVFVDEAHLIAADLTKGNLFCQALRLMPRAFMRWGLTGTAFMREEYHNWILEGATGPALITIKAKQLIEAGYLARPKIVMLRCPKLAIPPGLSWLEEYELGIVQNVARNAEVVDLVRMATGPVLVLVTRIAHGELLKSLCAEAGLRVAFLAGPVSVSERQSTWKALERSKLNAVIASNIADEGLDITTIQRLILTGGGKSKVKNIQRLGRGLRRTAGKAEVEVFDFLDGATRTLRTHAEARRKIWISEGHEVTLIDLQGRCGVS